MTSKFLTIIYKMDCVSSLDDSLLLCPPRSSHVEQPPVLSLYPVHSLYPLVVTNVSLSLHFQMSLGTSAPERLWQGTQGSTVWGSPNLWPLSSMVTRMAILFRGHL